MSCEMVKLKNTDAPSLISGAGVPERKARRTFGQ